MQEIILKAPAKINWTLDVLRKREDGYHDIATIMQSVAIYDEIIMKKLEKPQIYVKASTPNIPEGRANIAYRTAELMLDTFKIDGGIDIYIRKNIPTAAGMGGGSSDGAAVMLGIKEMYDIDVSLEELIKLGKNIGADIPFCIIGGTALAEGIGDKLTQLPPIDKIWLVVVKPKISISTAEVYNLVDTKRRYKRPQNEMFVHALYQGDLGSAAQIGSNALEEASAKLHPEIHDIKERLIAEGAMYALMSGSGPSVFGAFEGREEAEEAYNILKECYGQVFLTHTLDTGPIVLEG